MVIDSAPAAVRAKGALTVVCFANKAASTSVFGWVVIAWAMNPVVVIDSAPAAVRAKGALTVMGSALLTEPRLSASSYMSTQHRSSAENPVDLILRVGHRSLCFSYVDQHDDFFSRAFSEACCYTSSLNQSANWSSQIVSSAPKLSQPTKCTWKGFVFP